MGSESSGPRAGSSVDEGAGYRRKTQKGKPAVCIALAAPNCSGRVDGLLTTEEHLDSALTPAPAVPCDA